MKQAKLLFLLIAVLAFASCRPTARQAVADVEQPTDSTEAVTRSPTNTSRKPTPSYGGY